MGFGAPAVPHLRRFVDDERAYVQCNVGGTPRPHRGAGGGAAAAAAAPPRRPRVVRAAVSALANIDDPAAARAIHTVLRAATGEQRRAVIDALVAERDARVVPMLVRILDESEPLGKDHTVVLDTLTALKLVHTDKAVRPIARVADAEAVVRVFEEPGVQEHGGRGAGVDRHARNRSTALRRPLKATGCCASWRGQARAARAGDGQAAGERLDIMSDIDAPAKISCGACRRPSARASCTRSTHPLVQRSIDTLLAVDDQRTSRPAANAVVGFIGNDIVVNDLRLGKFSAQLVGFVRDMHEREIEKITFDRGSRATSCRRSSRCSPIAEATVPLPDRLAAKGRQADHDRQDHGRSR